MRALILMVLLNSITAFADPTCDGQVNRKVQTALNLIRRGHDLQILTLQRIAEFGRNSTWTNIFTDYRAAVGGHGLHRGFARLSGLMSSNEKSAAQGAALKLYEELKERNQTIDQAHTQAADIMVMRVGGRLPGSPRGSLERFEVAGTFQGRPVFSAVYENSKDVTEYIVDPMNPNPAERMVKLPGEFIRRDVVIDLQVGYFGNGTTVTRDGQIYDIVQKSFTGKLNFVDLGIRDLNENFVARVNKKEMLFSIVHVTDKTSALGFVRFDLKNIKARPKILKRGDFQYLDRNFVGERPYLSAVDLADSTVYVVNGVSGKVYKVPDVSRLLLPPVAITYEVDGRPFYALSVHVTEPQDGGPYIRIHDLEGGSTKILRYTGGTYNARRFFELNGKPYVCYSIPGKIIFKNLVTDREHDFAAGDNEDVKTIKPFDWKGVRHFVWVQDGSKLRILDTQTGSIMETEKAGENFRDLFPIEYQGEVYALATGYSGPPTLIKLTSTSESK